MIYKLRVILDAEEDVFRDIEIDSSSLLLDLNDAIKNAFLLEGQEMSSFYLSDDDWFQGKEIVMDESFGEDTDAKNMLNTTVEEVINKKSKRLLFVYDFLSMWTFFVEFLEERKGEIDFAQTVYEFGVKPETSTNNNPKFSQNTEFYNDEEQIGIDDNLLEDDLYDQEDYQEDIYEEDDF